LSSLVALLLFTLYEEQQKKRDKIEQAQREAKLKLLREQTAALHQLAEAV
jgi:hypothetical protein